MNIEKLIADIKKEQVELALSAMNTPSTDFAAYRQIVGRYAGLQRSLELLNEQLHEEER